MAYKPFKMKGHTLPGIKQRPTGNEKMADGRPGSSPFQWAQFIPMIASAVGSLMKKDKD